ncbi:MAG: hypothetical protein RR312_08635 [Bacteroidales bacterium]
MITASGIKKIFYAETSVITADLTAFALKTLLGGPSVKEVPNVHGDTWNLEESEASATPYKNALNGKVYRRDVEAGEIKANYTIGQYSYDQKGDLLGGTVIQKGTGAGATTIGWKRGDFADVKKTMVFLTKDDQYCVFPYASTNARETNADKAIGLSVSATPLEPPTTGIASEYWFDKAEVDAATSV